MRVKIEWADQPLQAIGELRSRLGRRIIDRVTYLLDHPRLGQRLLQEGLEDYRYLVVEGYRLITISMRTVAPCKSSSFNTVAWCFRHQRC